MFKRIIGMTLIKRILIDLWMRSPFASKQKARLYHEKKWNEKNFRRYASNVRDIFCGAQYIIESDYRKIFENPHTPGVRMYDNFRKEYCYPHRKLGEHTQMVLLRGVHTNDDRIFERNDFGEETLFLGTNSERDAVILQLKYGK